MIKDITNYLSTFHIIVQVVVLLTLVFVPSGFGFAIIYKIIKADRLKISKNGLEADDELPIEKGAKNE